MKFKKIAARIAGLALAGALVGVGGAVVTSQAEARPVEALDYYHKRYCDWPRRAVIRVVPNNYSELIQVYAYSPSGYSIGSNGWRGYYVWHTPWEDAQFIVKAPSGVREITSSCF